MNEPADFTSSYKIAVYNRDLEGFVALYDPGVRIFDMWEQWELRGLPALRKMATEWFDSLNDERVVVDFVSTELTQEGGMALVESFVRYAAQDTNGKELRSMHNRMTVVLLNNGGTWKVRHFHTSAPIDSETLKACFQLK